MFVVHGWVAGHPHNTTLDADFGGMLVFVSYLTLTDFRSLLLHMKANAANNGEEVLEEASLQHLTKLSVLVV